MNNYHLIWLIPMLLFVGIIIGIFVLPKEIDIRFEVVNDTKELWETSFYDLENLTMNMKNMCCYPIGCTQSKNNPDLCTCEYLVKCFNNSKKPDKEVKE